MMASLRARLLVAVLALTACGLLLAGAITYVEQRSFQYDRVDQQLRASILGVGHRLDQETGGPPGDYGDPDEHRGGGGGPRLRHPGGDLR